MLQPVLNFVFVFHSLFISFIKSTEFTRDSRNPWSENLGGVQGIDSKISFEGEVSLFIFFSASEFTFKEYHKPMTYQIYHDDTDDSTDNQIFMKTFSVHQIQENIQ